MKKIRSFQKDVLQDDDIGDEYDISIEKCDVETQTEPIEPKIYVDIDPEQAAFACLVEGIGFSQFQRLILFLNLPPPPKKSVL